MRLAEMTSPEVDALDRSTPVILPFAAIEQHGPWLPIATDALIAEGICERLDAKSPAAALLVPVQRFGSSAHHLPFAGTATLSGRTFIDAAVELAESFIAHGFRTLVLLNAHGGNRALLDVAVQEIRLGGPRRVTARADARELRVVHATYWSIAGDEFAAIRTSPEGGMGHAGEMETSVLLALHPELVRRDRLGADGRTGRSRFDERDMLRPGRVGQFRFFDEASREGPIGDARDATAEKGERFLDAAADALLGLLEDLREGRIG